MIIIFNRNSGPHGRINRVVERSTGRSYICEFIDLLSPDGDGTEKKLRKSKELVMNEIDNMRKLHHRKIHHLHEVFHGDAAGDDGDANKMAVVMEL